jgi:hypothetical protein
MKKQKKICALREAVIRLSEQECSHREKGNISESDKKSS